MVTDQVDLRDHGPRINVSDYFDLRHWAKQFGVTAGEVRRAVACVGDHPREVETYLEFARSMAAAGLEGGARWSR